MPWHEWVLLALVVVLVAAVFHYRDAARGQASLARYWQDRYDRERAKYRKLIEAMVKEKRGRRVNDSVAEVEQ